ncbi:MAG: hypothetical protein KDD61_06445 [Bdellovibrionales bacterium]|nr:hypothetical protein [Bdellovibrionales bacterium]
MKIKSLFLYLISLFTLLLTIACSEGDHQIKDSTTDLGSNGESNQETRTLSFTGTGGANWTHRIHYNSSDLSQISLKTSVTNENTRPLTLNMVHVIPFESIDEGSCITYFYGNGTLVANNLPYEGNIFYCRNNNQLEIQHGANINGQGFNPPFQSHGAVTLN